MHRSPLHSPKPSVATLALRSASAVLMGLGLAAAQDFGTLPSNFPSDLAEPGTKVLGVLNKAPGTGRTLGYSEGPVGDTEGNLYFTEDNAGLGNIWKVNAAGVGSNYYNGPGMPNGLDFDKDGNLYSAEKGGIAKYTKAGGSASRTMLPMKPGLNATYRINDVSVGSNGRMYFANHGQGNELFFRDPTKDSVTTYNVKTLYGLGEPNGAEYIEERNLVLLTCSASSKVVSFDVGPDGKLSNKKDWANVSVPDGLTLDSKGNVYVASYGSGSVFVFGPNGGTALGSFKIGNGGGGNASNVAFGGPDMKTLFITGHGGAYKVQMKVAGRPVPGTTRIRTGALRYSTPAAAFAYGYTLEGRKVNLISGVQATLKIMGAPLAR